MPLTAVGRRSSEGPTSSESTTNSRDAEQRYVNLADGKIEKVHICSLVDGRDVGLVTRQGMRLAALGLVLGAPFAFALTRLVASTFVTTSGATPQMVLAVVAVLASVAFVATYLPARRASRIQPVRALSTE